MRGSADGEAQSSHPFQGQDGGLTPKVGLGGGLRVIVADDHPVVHCGVRAVISKYGSGTVVATATHAGELFTALESHACDVLVTDFAMPHPSHPDGLQMLKQIRRLHPALPIVLISAARNVGILRAAASVGVSGIVDKTASLEDLAGALAEVANGRAYMSRSHEMRALESGDAVFGQHPAPRALSPREMEVLRLLAAGLTVTDIAEQLNRRVSTISRQKRDAMRKLNIRTDSALFEFLRSCGFT